MHASAASKSVTPDGLYITTKTLPKATKGKKYTTVKLAEKNGVGTETWSATGLPKGLTLSWAGSLSGTVSSSDAVKTYTVTITVKDSSKPTKQTATTSYDLVVLSAGSWVRDITCRAGGVIESCKRGSGTVLRRRPWGRSSRASPFG